MPKAYPIFDPSVRYLKMYRFFREEDVKVVYPDGSSYIVSTDEVRALLRNYRLGSYLIERILDSLWGFYSIQVDVVKGFWETIEPEPSDLLYSVPNALEGIEWIVGKNEYP